jgi:hypothetical protein
MIDGYFGKISDGRGKDVLLYSIMVGHDIIRSYTVLGSLLNTLSNKPTCSQIRRRIAEKHSLKVDHSGFHLKLL